MGICIRGYAASIIVLVCFCSTVLGGIIIPDNDFIGSVSDTDAMQIEADGDIVMSQDLSVVGETTTTRLLLTSSGQILNIGDGTLASNIVATFNRSDGVIRLTWDGLSLTFDDDIIMADSLIVQGSGGITIDNQDGGTDAVLKMDGSSNDPGTITYESDNGLFIVDKALTVTGTGTFGDIGIGINAPDKPLEIRVVSPIIRLRATGSTATQTAAYVEFGGTTTGSWDRTGYVGDGASGDTHIKLRAEDSDLYLGDSTSDSVVILSGGDATYTGTINIGDSGKITFRDTDISIGSTLTDGILDISADFAVDLFYDDADRGAEVDGQSLNINRRAAEGDDYISLYVDKDKKGLIGFSGDADLLSLASGVLTLNGDLILPATTFADQSGIINKSASRFIHDFNYGNNGTVTTTGQNMFIGSLSGNFTMGGTATETFHSSFNVGLGSFTLFANTTGYQNFAGGASTLVDNTTGFRNFAGGYFALTNNTIGFQNFGGGAFALRDNIDGDNNFGGGFATLMHTTDGNNNFAGGPSAGRYFWNGGQANLTTVNNSIFIGGTTRAKDNSGTNETVIGYMADGQGSNTVVLGNDSVTDTYLKGIVRLNDALYFTQTDGAEKIDSDADGTLDLYAGTSIELHDATNIGDGTNETQISATGVQTMAGDARVMKSVDLEPVLATRPASNPPDEGTEDSFATHDFNAATDESVFFHWEVPHNYASAGTIHVHFDFFVDTAEAGATSVVWGVEYKKLSVGDNFDFTADTITAYTQTSVTLGTPANDKKVHQSGEINLTTTGFVSGDYLLLRMFRDANGTGGTDSFPRDARVIDYHIEYLSDKLGEAL